MADIVILSSNYEGFSLAAVEGMASGKPVIASNVEALTTTVKERVFYLKRR
jgi:glycosyltransferase involved in cell wall biosynthesis